MLKKNNPDYVKQRRRKTKIDYLAVVSDFKKGLTNQEIAKKHNCSMFCIITVAKKYGFIKPKKKEITDKIDASNMTTDEKAKYCSVMLENGYTQSAIARSLKVSRQYIQHLLSLNQNNQLWS